MFIHPAAPRRGRRCGSALGSSTTIRALLAGSAVLAAGAAAVADPVVALTAPDPVLNTQRLLRFDSETPVNTSSVVLITGLQKNETILGIDFRPANGELYALGSTGRLYVIDPTGAAAQRGQGTFVIPLRGTHFGFDFNPTVDRIRITSNEGQNLRAHPDTGAIVDFDPNTPGVQPDDDLAYAMGDASEGLSPRVVASAYLNSFFGAAVTTLFNIDAAQNALVRQAPPNNRVLNTVAGVSLMPIPDAIGFDIAPRDNSAYITGPGSLPPFTGFYRLDLVTGETQLIGDIGVVPESIVGFSVEPSMCPCDFNGDYTLNSQDFFDYMNAFWAIETRANFNRDAAVNSQDFFDFLVCFFNQDGICGGR